MHNGTTIKALRDHPECCTLHDILRKIFKVERNKGSSCYTCTRQEVSRLQQSVSAKVGIDHVAVCYERII